MNISYRLKYLLQFLSLGRFVFKFSSSDSVYFTFDDGPHPEFTQDVLDTLDTYDVKATFFLIGENVEKYPEMVKGIQSRGHTIGLHTYTHKNIDTMTRAQFSIEIDRNQEVIDKIVNVRPSMLRPPCGKLSVLSILRSFLKRLKIIHFTITSNDWKCLSVENILDQVHIDSIKPGDIISFHDTNEYTCSAIKILIPEILQTGLKLEKI